MEYKHSWWSIRQAIRQFSYPRYSHSHSPQSSHTSIQSSEIRSDQSLISTSALQCVWPLCHKIIIIIYCSSQLIKAFTSACLPDRLLVLNSLRSACSPNYDAACLITSRAPPVFIIFFVGPKTAGEGQKAPLLLTGCAPVSPR